MKRLWLLALSLLIASCASVPLPGTVYKGRYFHNFENSAFTPEGSAERWCVAASDMAKAQAPGSRSGTADVVVRGELSAEGQYCNLGAYKRILKVYEVIDVSNIESMN